MRFIAFRALGRRLANIQLGTDFANPDNLPRALWTPSAYDPRGDTAASDETLSDKLTLDVALADDETINFFRNWDQANKIHIKNASMDLFGKEKSEELIADQARRLSPPPSHTHTPSPPDPAAVSAIPLRCAAQYNNMLRTRPDGSYFIRTKVVPANKSREDLRTTAVFKMTPKDDGTGVTSKRAELSAIERGSPISLKVDAFSMYVLGNGSCGVSLATTEVLAWASKESGPAARPTGIAAFSLPAGFHIEEDEEE